MSQQSDDPNDLTPWSPPPFEDHSGTNEEVSYADPGFSSPFHSWLRGDQRETGFVSPADLIASGNPELHPPILGVPSGPYDPDASSEVAGGSDSNSERLAISRPLTPVFPEYAERNAFSAQSSPGAGSPLRPRPSHRLQVPSRIQSRRDRQDRRDRMHSRTTSTESSTHSSLTGHSGSAPTESRGLRARLPDRVKESVKRADTDDYIPEPGFWDSTLKVESALPDDGSITIAIQFSPVITVTQRDVSSIGHRLVLWSTSNRTVPREVLEHIADLGKELLDKQLDDITELPWSIPVKGFAEVQNSARELFDLCVRTARGTLGSTHTWANRYRDTVAALDKSLQPYTQANVTNENTTIAGINRSLSLDSHYSSLNLKVTRANPNVWLTSQRWPRGGATWELHMSGSQRPVPVNKLVLTTWNEVRRRMKEVKAAFASITDLPDEDDGPSRQEVEEDVITRAVEDQVDQVASEGHGW